MSEPSETAGDRLPASHSNMLALKNGPPATFAVAAIWAISRLALPLPIVGEQGALAVGAAHVQGPGLGPRLCAGRPTPPAPPRP